MCSLPLSTHRQPASCEHMSTRVLSIALLASLASCVSPSCSTSPGVQRALAGGCPPPAAEGASSGGAATSGAGNHIICAQVLRGALVEALNTARALLEQHPRDSHLLNNVGCILLLALGKPSWSRSEACFKRALAENGLNAAAMYNYAMLLSACPHPHRHNKMCPAKQLFRAACRLDPSIPSAVLMACSVLEGSKSCIQLREMDDIDSAPSSLPGSSSDELDGHEMSDDAMPSSSNVLQGASTKLERSKKIVFGVQSRAHARLLRFPRSGDRAAAKSRGRDASRHRCSTAGSRGGGGSSGGREQHFRPQQGAEEGGSSCLTSVSSGASAALIFCTTPGTNKVLLARQHLAPQRLLCAASRLSKMIPIAMYQAKPTVVSDCIMMNSV